MIDKVQLETLVGQNLSQRAIAAELECSQCQVRYWLKKYGMKTNTTLSDGNCYQKTKTFNIFCDICDNYIKNNTRNHSKCMSCITKIRRARMKIAGIKMLGGKCVKCGWEGDGTTQSLAGFAFHHRDPNKKEFGIADVINKSWSVLKKELSKCDLVCARCHMILHAERYTEEFMEHVHDYNGNILDL